MDKKILWIRELSCGHSRPTAIAFTSGNYDKPNVGNNCYCRDCCEEVEIDSVEKAGMNLTKEFEKMVNAISKKPSGLKEKKNGW